MATGLLESMYYKGGGLLERTHCTYLTRSIFSLACSVKYQPIFHTLHFTLHHARVLNNIVLTTVIEIVETQIDLQFIYPKNIKFVHRLIDNEVCLGLKLNFRKGLKNQ